MKRALVTGGNKGIGRATTERLLDAGFEVVIVARDFAGFEWGDDARVHCEAYDLATLPGIPALAERIGPVDVLVNNAGIMNSLPYDDYPIARKETLMRVNLEAPIALISAFAEGLVKRGGRVVNVTSIAGQVGHPDIWYGVSKAGLINATKSFARALGGRGVMVNAVAPGPTETGMLATIPEARLAAARNATYSGRFASPEEVSAVILWLAVDAPEYVNGLCVDVNNGFFPR
jgi:NAD(P)-dependent dehydrogenase (short-subunit alcohol dehydrogenase family)